MTRRDWTFLFLIFAIALVVRTAWLDVFPPGLWMDEGLNGFDAWYSLHDGPRGEATGLRMVYPDVFPREPLLVWALAFALSLGGPRVIIMRLLTVMIGTLSCAVSYRAVRFIERDRGLALATGFVLATMHWHAHFSRLVFRTNWIPLLAIAVVCRMTWAAAGERKQGKASWWRWLLVGMLAGIGFYAYLSWYFFLPVIVIWFWALRSDAEEETTEPAKRRFWWAAVPFILGAVIVYSPLGAHYLTAPKDLTGRAQAISPLNDGLGQGLRLMARNAADVALMFAFRGDHVPLHNVARPAGPDSPDFGKTGSPVFDPVWGLFFYAGLGLALLEALRARGRKRRVAVAWLAWIVMMSLPSVVSQTDSANTLRNLGATPAVAFFVAKSWWRFYTWVCQRLKGLDWPKTARNAAAYACIVLFLWGAAFQVHKLWWRHPNQPQIDHAFSWLHVQLASLSTPDAEALLFVPKEFYEHRSYAFLTIGREDIRPLDTRRLIQQNPEARDHRVLCSIFAQQNLAVLQAVFPDGQVEQNRLLSPGGEQVIAVIYRIPSEALLPPGEAAEKVRAIRLEENR